MNVTQELVNFIVNTDHSEIPSEAREIGKRAILDCLGVSLAGSQDQISMIILEFLKDTGGQAIASVWGKKFQSSAPLAALANATFSHALDYDDWNRTMRGHPTAPVLPAVFALGEEKKASGREVLDAYLIGFEVEAKLGAGLNPHLPGAGWHPTAVLGVMGASAAASKLLKLDSNKVKTALAVAASHAAGLRQNFGTMTKPLQVGQAAMNGILAAKLAEGGFSAGEQIIEEKFGYAKVFAGKGNYDLQRICKGLGRPFEILLTGVGFKQYPSCARTHPAIDAMLDIVTQNEICPEDVESVSCGGSYTTPQLLLHSRPKTALEGKFSIEFCLAIALLEKEVELSQFTDKKVQDPKVQEMIKKVEFYIRPDLSTIENSGNPSATVKVLMRDGREFVKQVNEAKGSPGNPLTQDDIRSKYRDCARLVHSEVQIDKAIEMVENLDALKDITSLIDILD